MCSVPSCDQGSRLEFKAASWDGVLISHISELTQILDSDEMGCFTFAV